MRAQHIFIFIYLYFYYSYVHTVLGSFLSPAPTSSLATLAPPPSPPHPFDTQQKLGNFALISNFVEERV
jgi:hypothetical protein